MISEKEFDLLLSQALRSEQAIELVDLRNRVRAEVARTSHRGHGRITVSVGLLWRAGLAAALALAAITFSARIFSGDGAQVTFNLPGYVIVASANNSVTPKLTKAQAIAIALQSEDKASSPSSNFEQLTVSTASFAPHVKRIWNCNGHVYLSQIENVWIVQVAAPPQDGFRSIGGVLLVDDDKGSLASGAILASHTTLPTCTAP